MHKIKLTSYKLYDLWLLEPILNNKSDDSTITSWMNTEVFDDLKGARRAIELWKSGNEKDREFGGNMYTAQPILDFVFIEFWDNVEPPCDENEYLLLTFDQALDLLDKYEAHLEERKKVTDPDNPPVSSFTVEYVAAGEEARKLVDEIAKQEHKPTTH